MCRSGEFDCPHVRLPEIMEGLRLDLLVALRSEPAAFAAAIARCRTCESDTACRDWLAQAGPTIESPPAFCPGAGLLAGLQGKQPVADIGGWF